MAALGRIGRRLLRRALDSEPYRSDLVYVGLDAVAATYATDPQGSRDLLGRFVAPERMARLGWQELSWVMDALFTLRREEPGLVAQLYASAFAAPEPDGTAVPMGGPVTTLISNRGQDFRVALTNLAERFPAFLKDAPEAAVGALIEVCRTTREQRSLVADAPERELQWQGQTGTVIDAFSAGLDL